MPFAWKTIYNNMSATLSFKKRKREIEQFSDGDRVNRTLSSFCGGGGEGEGEGDGGGYFFLLSLLSFDRVCCEQTEAKESERQQGDSSPVKPAEPSK